MRVCLFGGALSWLPLGFCTSAERVVCTIEVYSRAFLARCASQEQLELNVLFQFILVFSALHSRRLGKRGLRFKV